LYILTENPVVSPQIISKFNVSTSNPPDKNLNSENPTMVLSENKKARKRKVIPLPAKSILRILFNDKDIPDPSIKINVHLIISTEGGFVTF